MLCTRAEAQPRERGVSQVWQKNGARLGKNVDVWWELLPEQYGYCTL